jgi:regulator of replication initiation timing
MEEIKRHMQRLIEINTRILRELEELNKALTRGDRRINTR